MKNLADIDRLLRRSLVVIAIAGLASGGVARIAGYTSLADQCWFAATVPVIAGLAYSIVRDLLSGRVGVDAIALLSMIGALALGQPLAGAVVALMYSGGNVLEDFAVAPRRARSALAGRSRAARRASPARPPHRGCAGRERRGRRHAPGPGRRNHSGRWRHRFNVGRDRRVGADRRAAPAETKTRGSSAFSGTLNAGEAFELVASSLAGDQHVCRHRAHGHGGADRESAVRAAGGPLCADLPAGHACCRRRRLADFGRSGSQSRRVCRGDAVSRLSWRRRSPSSPASRRRRSAASWSRAAAPLEALARTHTVLFDKTGTLTVGGARLLSIEVAPGEQADRVLAARRRAGAGVASRARRGHRRRRRSIAACRSRCRAMCARRMGSGIRRRASMAASQRRFA